MKQSVTRYVIVNKRDGSLLERIVFVGASCNGAAYDWVFTKKATEAMQASKGHLNDLLSRDFIHSVTPVDINDLEIKKVKITYEY